MSYESPSDVFFISNSSIHEAVNLAISEDESVMGYDVELSCDEKVFKTSMMPDPQWGTTFTFNANEKSTLEFKFFVSTLQKGRTVFGKTKLSFSEIESIQWRERSLELTSDSCLCSGILHVTIDTGDESNEGRRITIFVPSLEEERLVLRPQNAYIKNDGIVSLQQDLPPIGELGRFPRSPVAIGPCAQPEGYRPQIDSKIRATPIAFFTQRLDE